jgi:hypothetical protein
MLGRLVTLETYMNAMQATLAKNYLESAGIRCVLSDEFVVSNFWQLSNAVGGIKLQVAEEDIERASDLLDEIENLHRAGPKPPDATETPATDQGSASVEDPPEAAPPEPKPGADDEEDEPPLNAREDNAERAYRAVIVGTMIIPLQLYATWVLLDVWQSDLPLRPAVRRKLHWAIGLHIPMLLFALVVIYFIMGGMINLGSVGVRF